VFYLFKSPVLGAFLTHYIPYTTGWSNPCATHHIPHKGERKALILPHPEYLAAGERKALILPRPEYLTANSLIIISIHHIPHTGGRKTP
jgi:hypothetical protein